MFSAGHFELDISATNLQNKSLFIEPHHLPGTSETKLKFHLEKLDAAQFLDNPDFNRLLTDSFNEKLQKKVLLASDNTSISLRFEDNALLREHASQIISCPVGLTFQLVSRGLVEGGSGEELCSLAMVVVGRSQSWAAFKECKLTIELGNKLRNKMLNSTRFEAGVS